MIRRFLIILALPLALAARAKDTIELLDGEKITGTILAVRGTSLMLRRSLEGGTQAEFSLPVENIKSVTFDRGAKLFELLDQPTVPLPELERTWTAEQPFLALPGSPAGRAGLRMADQLVLSGERADAVKALGALDAIIARGPDDEIRIEAAALRPAALYFAGQPEKAVEAAREFSKLENTTPAQLSRARLVLGLAALGELETLVEENPRWREDARVKPRHDALKFSALEHFLHPFLFVRQAGDAEAAGLYYAARVSRMSGDTEAIERYHLDLTTLHPQSPYTNQTRDLLPTPPTPSTP